MTLAERIRSIRENKNLSLDELAARAKISKTYLWELEKDVAGAKKPSADVLLKIANALSTTIADLLAQPVVRIQEVEIPIPKALQELRVRLKSLGEELSDADVRDLATVKFRGGQPDTVEGWHQLYYMLKVTQQGKNSS